MIRGWELYIQWKDGLGSWVVFKDLKESYLVELAKYGKTRGLVEEPAFALWANHILKKCNRVLLKIKSKYWEKTHKYGIRIPKSIKEVKRINQENKDMLQIDTIRLKIKNNWVAFKEYDGPKWTHWISTYHRALGVQYEGWWKLYAESKVLRRWTQNRSTSSNNVQFYCIKRLCPNHADGGSIKWPIY